MERHLSINGFIKPNIFFAVYKMEVITKRYAVLRGLWLIRINFILSPNNLFSPNTVAGDNEFVIFKSTYERQ